LVPRFTSWFTEWL